MFFFCIEDYIGESGRKLNIRINEHFTRYKNRTRLSEVGSHGLNKHDKIDRNDWEVKVIYLEQDEFTRKMAESYFIKLNKPSLNVSQGALVIGHNFFAFKTLANSNRDVTGFIDKI